MDYRNLKIIAVEDDPLSRDILTVLLTKLMNVQAALILENSADFPAILADYTDLPHLIFLDIRVQPYDGYAMLKMIQAKPGWEQVKVVAITASVMANEVTELRAAGFHSLISKPINPDTFLEYINQMLADERVWIVSWD